METKQSIFSTLRILRKFKFHSILEVAGSRLKMICLSVRDVSASSGIESPLEAWTGNNCRELDLSGRTGSRYRGTQATSRFSRISLGRCPSETCHHFFAR